MHIVFSWLAGAVLCGLLPAAAHAQTRKAQPLEAVNSLADELMPVMAPDNTTIYFVRSAHPGNVGGAAAGQDIWYSGRQTPDAAWNEPRNIGAPLNNPFNNAVGSVAREGKVLWLNNQYLGRNKMKPGLSFSTATAGGWSRPQPVNIRDFKPETGALGFFLAPGDSILFISMQTDSSRSEDIFISRQQAGQWSAPVNIGVSVNSAGFEIAPFLAPDNETLYFASNGHGGLGQSDIFKSKRLDNSWDRWSEPENLGPDVNSAGFEAYFILDPAGDRAYFTSEDGEKPDTDIYSIRVSDMVPRLQPPPPARAGGLLVEMPAVDGQPDKAQTLVVSFGVGSARINAAAAKALQDLARLQQAGGQLTISGHADDTGQAARNVVLSRERAQAVARLLIQAGIKKDRIRVEAFGSRRPVSPAAGGDLARNRRVEVHFPIR